MKPNNNCFMQPVTAKQQKNSENALVLKETGYGQPASNRDRELD
jgi:hypothetical protein